MKISQSTISRGLFFVCLSGCSINVPVIGPTFDDIEESPCVQEALRQCQETENGSLFVENTLATNRPEASKFEFYRWAALQGYSKAYVIVADDYFARGTLEDRNEAIYWLEKGVSESDLGSLMRLARYLSLEDPAPDYQRAQGLLESLRSEDYIPALLLSAKIAEVSGNQEAQLRYLDKARQLGDPSAAERLEKLIVEPQSAEEHSMKTVKSPYQELADLKGFWADLPITESEGTEEVTVGTLSTQGELKALFEQAANQDSSYASLMLAQDIFYQSFHSYRSSEQLKQYLDRAREIPAAKSLYARSIFAKKIPGSLEQAYRFLEEAAKQDDPYALFYLSLHERLIKKDYEQSLAYYYRAQQVDLSSRGQYHVALDLLEGRYSFLADKIAHTWIASLAAVHYPPALLTLANLKEEGKVLCQEDKEVFVHRAQAAYLGNPQAAYQLGNMYFKGTVAHVDQKKAFLWFMHAARRGYVPAQYQLSQMYRQGYGVIADKVKSYAWMTLVPSLYEGQASDLEDLLSQMSQEEIARSLHMSDVLTKYYSQPASFVNF